MLLFLIVLIIFVVILLFSSKTFSPIPYFPTQKIDLPKIVKSLKLNNNQTIVDLGAGDGIVIFEAAKKSYLDGLNTKFVAVEINPILIIILYLRRLFHPNQKNIKIVYGDMFSIDFKNFINFNNFLTFYIYISPWFLKKTLSNIKNQISKFKVVSYMYPLKNFNNKIDFTKVTEVKGKNSIFSYDF